MKLKMIVHHPYVTEDFYGESVPNFVGEVFEVSNSESTKLTCRTEIPLVQCLMGWSNLKMSGNLYQWTIRQQEILSSARDYELTIDINSVMAKSDELTYIPNTIKKLIGLFCNPVIASGFIVFAQSD